jgi:hypothetical protein
MYVNGFAVECFYVNFKAQGKMKKMAGFGLSISSAVITAFRVAVIEPSGFSVSFLQLVRKRGGGRRTFLCYWNESVQNPENFRSFVR